VYPPTFPCTFHVPKVLPSSAKPRIPRGLFELSGDPKSLMCQTCEHFRWIQRRRTLSFVQTHVILQCDQRPYIEQKSRNFTWTTVMTLSFPGTSAPGGKTNLSSVSSRMFRLLVELKRYIPSAWGPVVVMTVTETELTFQKRCLKRHRLPKH